MPIPAAALAKYPFLSQARKYIVKLELDIKDMATIATVRDLAKHRVYSSFDLIPKTPKKANRDYETEIISYTLALLYLSEINDDKLTQRFASSEANKVNFYLKKEKNKEVIFEIAKEFGWIPIQVNDAKSTVISIHFTTYLKMTSRGRLSHNTTWQLKGRSIKNGQVQVNPKELARLLQEEVNNHLTISIEKNTKQKIPNLPFEIQKDIDELSAEYQKRKPQFEKIIVEVQATESEYPPCISSLIGRATNGQHLSHVERFTMVTYLLHQGVEIDSIVNLFSKVSDFKEEKTRYQIENLAGQRGGIIKPYVTYNCATLQTHNVCPYPNDPICNFIRNPLTYHLKKKIVTT